VGFVSARLLKVASDERLVELVRQGSQPAFEVLYDRHHRGILAFCRHMLASREEAEDAVQHTFMAAYRDLLGSDKEIQLRAWLYAIARNRCLSVLRARRERPLDEIEDVPTEGLANEVQRRADLRDMLRDLAALPEDQRAALVLAEIGDLPHDDIAAVIGCRKEKVKALVFQARSSLHASRDARDADCAEMRELISTLRGGALRRTTLRRHLKDCSGCRAFRDEVDRQRRAMAILLPVAPTVALKSHVLSSAFSGGSAAGAAGVAASAGGTAAGLGAASGVGATATVASGGGAVIAAKALVVAVAVGGGAVGIKEVAVDGPLGRDAAAPAALKEQGGHKTGNSPKQGPGGAAVVVPAGATERGKSKTARGHTDRGKKWARTRGKGKKHGLNGTQPGQTGLTPAGTNNGKKPAATPTPKPTHTPQGKAKGKSKKPVAKPKHTPAPKPERTAVPTPTPRVKPTATPKPERTPASQATPELTAAPTGAATETPTG
jgi:RNA polymerase sigma factor (sigma-70 family)